MEETETDDVGMMFCKKHHREVCHCVVTTFQWAIE